MRTVVTFESDKFNLTDEGQSSGDYGCYGQDLAKWLIDRLRAAGTETDSEPRQEDFGWYVNYSLGGQPFCAVIGNVGGESWFIVVERVTGFLRSLLGERHRHVPEAGVDILHRVLSTSPELRNIRWHKWEAFRRGGADTFSSGSASPEAL